METTQHLSGLHRARGLRFGLVGLSGVLVNSAVLWLLAVALGLPVIVASALATEAAVLSNFLLNDSWTFRSRSHCHAFGRRLLRYHGVAAGGAVVSLGVLAALTAHSRLPLLVANLFAIRELQQFVGDGLSGEDSGALGFAIRDHYVEFGPVGWSFCRIS